MINAELLDHLTVKLGLFFYVVDSGPRTNRIFHHLTTKDAEHLELNLTQSSNDVLG
jgi:hypothetical protein